ncbi:MAG: fused MFS/spermidine synthase [Methylococcaceae bacterium]|nr:fused MFS/spermidine synthase [Methylococcaceae bacterium]
MSNSPLHASGRAGLFLTVFMTGAGVMVIELLGTRMIAPFYGASLYVWSSLISVTMIALAIGYFVGGRWADRAERTGLSLIIALAAFLTLLIPWLTRPVLLATDPLGLRGGAFVSALILFSPSLTLLGMVGPFAIKLSTTQLDGVGASSGSIYAVSTLGSVVGTLVLGFFLFPLLGSREILIGLGFVLLLLSVVVAFFEQKRLGASAAFVPCVVLTILGLCLLPQIAGAGHVKGNSKFKILSEHESLYGWVRVMDQSEKDLRVLTSDASAIGAAGIAHGENRLTYQSIVGLIPAMAPPMKRALIIGLGAGLMKKVLSDQYGIETDTLEIDPAVADAAVDFFGFTPAGMSIIGDARYEIRHLKGPYDLIIHDCFTGGTEPSHLLTVETLKQLRGLLSEKGILALNFVAFYDGGHNPSLAAVSKTLRQVFSQQAFFVADPGENFNDYIFLAANQPIDLQAKSLLADQIAWLKERNVPLDSSKGIILTDNFNPLEHLQTAKSEQYRRLIVEMFGPELLVR